MITFFARSSQVAHYRSRWLTRLDHPVPVPMLNDGNINFAEETVIDHLRHFAKCRSTKLTAP